MSQTFYPQALALATPDQLREAFGVSDWFVYECDFSDLAPASITTQTVTVEADSNFLWQQGIFAADIADAAFTVADQPLPNVSINIQDTGSGRNLMSSAVPVQSIFGTGREPFMLMNPRWFRSNTTFKVTVNNYDADATYNLRLSFVGTKFFNYPG